MYNIYFPFRDDCKKQVDKFPNAIFKKFATEEDAWAFVGAAGSSSQSTPRGKI